jgi:hypothetical protein
MFSVKGNGRRCAAQRLASGAAKVPKTLKIALIRMPQAVGSNGVLGGASDGS